MFKVLEGKNASLKVVEKEDLALLKEWRNNIEFTSEYQSISQETAHALSYVTLSSVGRLVSVLVMLSCFGLLSQNQSTRVNA